MSQQDVIDWLAAHPGWHTTGEISKGTGICLSIVRDSLRRLKKWGDVERSTPGKSNVVWWKAIEANDQSSGVSGSRGSTAENLHRLARRGDAICRPYVDGKSQSKEYKATDEVRTWPPRK
ncbi:MAG: hypothetical protein A4E48_00249 [Methanosaeta sp. PtaU1.Bin060]|nr:MAG: hypothetical protein A4E48_00249 [Methanosaeta sp. PtaU1.Bin060]